MSQTGWAQTAIRLTIAARILAPHTLQLAPRMQRKLVMSVLARRDTLVPIVQLLLLATRTRAETAVFARTQPILQNLLAPVAICTSEPRATLMSLAALVLAKTAEPARTLPTTVLTPALVPSSTKAQNAKTSNLATAHRASITANAKFKPTALKRTAFTLAIARPASLEPTARSPNHVAINLVAARHIRQTTRTHGEVPVQIQMDFQETRLLISTRELARVRRAGRR